MFNRHFYKRSAKLVMIALVLFLTIGLGGRAVELRAADDTWRARYWNNKSMAGDPVLDRQEKNISHDWGDDSPGPKVNSDGFSARWTRVMNLPAGTYRFTATMDDGMRIWLGETMILDSWYDSQAHTEVVTTHVPAGEHRIKVEYYENGGKAAARLLIEPVSSDIVRWRGEYFSNPTLSGSPTLVRNDDQINFDWGGGAPAANVPADNFSVRWTRTVNLDQGRYRFTTTTDDGVRLWVNGRLLIDKWFDQAPTTYSAELDLPSGPAEIRMEYYEGSGGASARLERAQLSGPSGDGSWRGEYFNNKDLSGNPSLVRNDAHIAFNWGNGSPGPGINPDKFSVRWTRTLNLSPGQYRFTTVTDDGVRLWVNGQQIINAWIDNKPQENVGNIYLPGGSVEIRMEYYENAGGAQANLSRTLVSASPAGPTPTPQPTGPTATVVNARLNVREGPGTAFAILQVLGQGDRVTLLARNEWNTWAQVRTPNGLVGWVYAPLLQTSIPIANLPVAGGTGGSPNGSGPNATLSNAAYVLNVRSGPGTNFESIAKILRGQQVRMLGRNASSTWIKVQLEDGRQGWSSAAYLVSTTPFANLPVVSN
jgi:uncharacterized protein YraI